MHCNTLDYFCLCRESEIGRREGGSAKDKRCCEGISVGITKLQKTPPSLSPRPRHRPSRVKTWGLKWITFYSNSVTGRLIGSAAISHVYSSPPAPSLPSPPPPNVTFLSSSKSGRPNWYLFLPFLKTAGVPNYGYMRSGQITQS